MAQRNRESSVLSCLFLYGFSLAFFKIVPPLLPAMLRSPLTQGDVLDFLTPFVVIGVVYLVFSRLKDSAREDKTKMAERPLPAGKSIVFFGSLFFASGHGIHLAANSIARLVEDQKGSTLYRAVYLFDEVISHYIWDSGLLLISLGLIVASLKVLNKHGTQAKWAALAVGAALYGFTYTVSGIEGQTVPLTFPAAIVLFLGTLVLYLKYPKKKRENPVLIFFLGAYLLSLVLFAYWGLRHSGFPEFSDLGWI